MDSICCPDSSSWLSDRISSAMGDHHAFHTDVDGHLYLNGHALDAGAPREGDSDYTVSSGVADVYDHEDFNVQGAWNLFFAGEQRKAAGGEYYILREFKDWYGDIVGERY